MNSVDKNDVDIAKLFEWKREFVLEDNFGEEVAKVYMRIPGDADVNRARIYGIRKATELRKKLNDKDSDERVAFIPPIELVSKEGLIQAILALSMKEYSNEAINNIEMPYPKEPKSDAKQEKWEQFQAEVDNYPKERLKIIATYMQKAMEKHERDLEKQDIESLFPIYEKLMINDLCEKELEGAYTNMCIYLNTYKDEELKTRAFDSIADYENLPRWTKDKLYTNYQLLELDSLELKK